MSDPHVSLRLLCHNVYWFQGQPFKSDQPGDPRAEIVDGLAQLYREAAPDVLCLQEVHRAEIAVDLAARLGMQVAHCPGAAYPQYGGAILWRGEGGIVADSRGRAVQRVWQVGEICLSTGPLRIATLHLPSKRQLGPEASEIQRLHDLDDMLAASDSLPDIICGDFNEVVAGGPVAAHLDALGYRDAAQLAGQESRPSNVGGSRGDWIRLRADLAPRLLSYASHSATDLRLSTDPDRYLSDHLPVRISLA